MSEEILRAQIVQKAWEDQSFYQKLLTEPKAAIKEAFGVAIPDKVEMKTVQENENLVYLVIPPSPTKVLSTNTTLDTW